MRHITVPEIVKSHKGRRLKLKGGWQAPLPEVKMEQVAQMTMHKGLQAKYPRAKFEERQELLEDIVHDVWWRGWYYHLKWFIVNWMCYYADRFPLLGDELLGFPSELLASYWMPGRREHGRRDEDIRAVLDRAGREALKEVE